MNLCSSILVGLQQEENALFQKIAYEEAAYRFQSVSKSYLDGLKLGEGESALHREA